MQSMVSLEEIREAREKFKEQMRKKYGNQWHKFCPECGAEFRYYDYMDFKGNIGYTVLCPDCGYKEDRKFEPIPKY